MNVKILATGSVLPGTIVSNEELALMLGVSADDLARSSGIKARSWLSPGDTGAKWGAASALLALNDLRRAPSDLQAIFYSTVTPDHQFPGNAAFTQSELGIVDQAILDIRACDGGFLHTLAAASDYIRTGFYDFVLLGSNDFFSTYIRRDPKGAGISELFGDGGAAWILGPSNDESGILSLEIGNDPTCVRSFWAKTPGTYVRPRMTRETIENGEWHFSLDVTVMEEETRRLLPRIARKALETAGVSPADIRWFVSSCLKSAWGMETAGILGIAEDRVARLHEGRGYYGTAMIPTAFDQGLRAGEMKKGDLVLAAAIGSGVSYSAMVYRV